MNRLRALGSALLLVVLGLACQRVPAEVPLVLTGEAIYARGVLGSGAPLDGVREDNGQSVRGAGAACVHCHRNSGLGSQEGAYPIPPVAGRYLFHSHAGHGAHQELPHVVGERPQRSPYTDESLARAIREGIDSDGKPLGYLMPRFALDDADMAALIAYLKNLAPSHAPGVSPTLLHFATIITPDADPAKKRGMLDVLEHFFAEKNAQPWGAASGVRPVGGTGRPGGPQVASPHWQLHVWELQGPPAEWGAQLQRHFAEEPVMAVVSGVGGSDWSPVHDFCEQAHLPCLFPNVEVPVVGDHDFYSLYFSNGVLLEAQLMAWRIGSGAAGAANGPVQQVYRAGESGAAGARALADALRKSGRASQDLVIPATASADAVRQLVQQANGQSALVLWLRPDDLKVLADVAPPPAPVYASGLMAGLEDAPLPEGWREKVVLTYPFDLPARRLVRVDYPLGWFRLRKIPVVALQVQADTFLACGMLVDALSHMGQNLVPDYLVEMIGDVLGHRTLTGYYPRLSLAEGQQFASKGGYLVQLASPAKGGVAPASDWVVP